jgi:RNA polymerase sigma-70 factor (ECF subfamily)
MSADHRPEPAANGRALDLLTATFTAQRARLLRTVQLHLDARLVGRVDPDDVLQESFLVAQRRFDPEHPPPVDSLFVWLRTIVMQTTVDAARRHLGAASRSAQNEVRIESAVGATTAQTLTNACLSRLTSPTAAAVRAELGEKLAAAIAEMSELDREILLLRHFEELGNGETAIVLGIHKAAATNRYLRALRRLREVLPAGFGGAP